MPITIRLLDPDDADVLANVAEGTFDHEIDDRWTQIFFADPHSHLVVALDGDVVVGMVSCIDYVHPDKPPQLWINEVGVGTAYRQRGIATHLLGAALDLGRALGCTEAWLGTADDNAPARRLYERAGGVAEPFVLYSFPLVEHAHDPSNETP